MTAAADHFTSFVDVLADALDDHEATGEDLAARLYLSRFHLDRIVASVAGEPPSRLRRRLLLERSAYRLVTTQDTILDIAVEAGYGSHEAFTRAFTRAYGVGPSALAHPADADPDRGAQRRPLPPTREHPAPRENAGDRHGPPHQDGRAPRLADRRDRRARRPAHRRAARRADRAQRRRRPADHPVAASRLVGQMGMWNAAIADRAYDWSVEEHESVDSLRSRLAVEGPAYLAQVREVVEQGRLDDTFVDALCEPADRVHLRRDDRPRAHVRGPPALPRA